MNKEIESLISDIKNDVEEVEKTQGNCRCPIFMAKKAVLQLVNAYENGLNPVYRGDSLKECFENFLFDWFPNLPWERRALRESATYIIRNCNPILEKLQDKFNFNMKKELTVLIEELDQSILLSGRV